MIMGITEQALGWGVIGAITSMLVALFGLLVRSLLRSVESSGNRADVQYRTLEVERDWYRKKWLESLGTTGLHRALEEERKAGVGKHHNGDDDGNQY